MITMNVMAEVTKKVKRVLSKKARKREGDQQDTICDSILDQHKFAGVSRDQRAVSRIAP